MAAPLNDLVLVFRRIWKIVRWLSLGIIVVTGVVLAFQVAEIHGMLSGVHPWLGHLFLVLLAVALAWGVGLPIARFLKMPVVLRPPEMPSEKAELKLADVERRAEFLTRYVRCLRRNPLLKDARGSVDEALAAGEALRQRIGSRATGDAEAALAEVGEFERTRLEPLLAPIDAEADRIIRREALGVGIATGLAPIGTMDAFIVLWRNANMVSRVANLYYGRPGARGSLLILRDVSTATLVASYLEGLSDAAGEIIGNFLGSVAGVFAGPVIEGSINALATMRIGYTARARCRSFQAWTERSRAAALKDALAAAKSHSKDVLGEIVQRAGGGLAKVPGKAIEAARDGLGSLWRKVTGQGDETEPEPAG